MIVISMNQTLEEGFEEEESQMEVTTEFCNTTINVSAFFFSGENR